MAGSRHSRATAGTCPPPYVSQCLHIRRFVDHSVNNAVADLSMMSHRRAGLNLSDALPVCTRICPRDVTRVIGDTVAAMTILLPSLCPGRAR